MKETLEASKMKMTGFPDVKGEIGACLASSCRFNNKLECQAAEVNVTSDDKHADCTTFQKK
jgi:hypothetical protein